MISNKLFNKNLYRSNGAVLILTALLTTFSSEFRLVPFEGEAFRFGLGSITFFLLILIWSPVSIVRTGFVTGLTVIFFRILADVINGEVLLKTSFIDHLPAFLFYFIFGLGLHIVKIEKYKTFPLVLGAWAAFFEFTANGVEHLMRQILLEQANLNLRDLALLIGVALLRSYFVVGLYASITVSEQKKRMQELLKVGSELYGETLYLQKSMNHIEKITADSHDLYRRLKKEGFEQLSVEALHIAQEIHEVKKDSQRILSGLTKITEQKRNDDLLLSDILNLVVTANEKYSEMLKKRIGFQVNLSVDYHTNQQIPLLAVLNNLIANAVESISDDGEITIEIFEEAANTCFLIKDSGKGIPKEDLPIIFEPGYTTKFNEQGVAATGIGLSHVKEIVHTLKGQVQIESSETGTIFRIDIPTVHLMKGVE